MSAWDMYVERVSQTGTMRDAIVEQTRTTLANMMYDSPSCHKVTIDGEEQQVVITHRDNISEKRITSIPGEKLKHGGIVSFRGSTWLITEIDADDEVYDRGLMVRCNHILRWIGRDGTLKEKWCVIEDGTKYLIGEYTERIMAIGDARIAMTIAKDEDTVELRRGVRFLIDDPDSDECLAYQITKPNKLFNTYDGKGVFKFILNEVQSTKEDNKALRIADYANWMPNIKRDGDHVDSEQTIAEIVDAATALAQKKPDDNKKGWL